MNDVVIQTENLSKKYRLGARAEPYKTLRESFSRAAISPLRVGRSIVKRRPDGEPNRRPDFWALKDVSFEVKRGEVLGIIGRNGAGKSTLLKLLSRITQPTEGRVRVKGQVASLLEVGSGFHPELSGRENIFLNGAILGMSRADIVRKFDEIVSFAEVERFIDTPVKRYSSGMYLRLAFAVAAHLDPEILIIDEVLAVGDADFQRKCLGKVGAVSRAGRTVVFVSHNMSAVSALCSRGVVLDRGRVAMQGPVEAAVASYLASGTEGSRSVDLIGHPDNNSTAIRFESLRVAQGTRGPLTTVTTDADIEAYVSYRILRPVRGIEVSIAVELADGQFLLSTTDVDATLDLDRMRAPGRYTAMCSFPRSFFRSGRYYLHCGSSRPNAEQLVHLRQVLGFDVVDTNGVETQTGQRRLGLVAPRLPWRVVESPAKSDTPNTRRQVGPDG
jgi:lipopolysaccharide transport system ATP-binding protein